MLALSVTGIPLKQKMAFPKFCSGELDFPVGGDLEVWSLRARSDHGLAICTVIMEVLGSRPHGEDRR